MSQFDLRFLQAVNDWQRGGDHKQKVKRGRALKALSLHIDGRFRTCTAPYFRQEAHDKSRLWQLLADDTLDETIAAWTTDLQSSMDLKGGVPPPDLQGVIFEITSTVGSVVLNLVELYQDPQFIEAAQRFRSEIIAYGDGIGRYSEFDGGPGASLDNEDCVVLLERIELSTSSLRMTGSEFNSRDIYLTDWTFVPVRALVWLPQLITAAVLQCLYRTCGSL